MRQRNREMGWYGEIKRKMFYSWQDCEREWKKIVFSSSYTLTYACTYYIHMYTWMNIYEYIYVCICICLYIYMIYRANRFFQPEQNFRTVSYEVIKAKSINTYIYIYKNIFVYICMYIYVCIFMNMYLCTVILVVYIYIYIYIYIYTYICIYVRMYVYVYTYIHDVRAVRVSDSEREQKCLWT